MHKPTIVCDPLTAEVFMLTDFLVRPAADGDSAEQILGEICRDGQSIVFVTENLAKDLQARIAALQKQYLVTISLIPGIGDTEKFGEKLLKKLVNTVIGSAIPDANANGQ